jgi:hypothetical protein
MPKTGLTEEIKRKIVKRQIGIGRKTCIKWATLIFNRIYQTVYNLNSDCAVLLAMQEDRLKYHKISQLVSH